MTPPRPRSFQPALAIELEYRRKLDRLIDEMHASVLYWVQATFRANEPEIARDELPANALKRVLKTLSARWDKNFREAADRLAAHFARAAAARTDAQLRRILRQAGFTVAFKMTRAMRDILKATVQQNVALISSLPQQYMKGVEGAVMRSVQTGRDVGGLTRELREQYGVAKRRAETIAVDQNNKATSAFTRARQAEVGIRRARWMHSHAGKVPRRSHVANNGKVYEIAEGWYDPDEREWIWPGVLVNCRCTSQSLIPGVHKGA